MDGMKGFITQFALTFAVALVAAAVVTYLWSLVAEGQGTVDWGTVVPLAIVLGIVLPVSMRPRRR